MPPTSVTSRRAAPLPPEQRRAAILSAVLPLLIEHGSSITTRDIAQAAGVSEGTLFKVFDDKAALIAAALDQALDQAPFEQSVREVDPSLTFADQLVAVVALSQRRVVDIWRLLSHIDTTHPARPIPDSPALAALFAAHGEHTRIDPADAARLLRALTLSLTHPLMTPAPSSADEIVDIFLTGIGQ